jgi:hypothetical protein
LFKVAKRLVKLRNRLLQRNELCRKRLSPNTPVNVNSWNSKKIKSGKCSIKTVDTSV